MGFFKRLFIVVFIEDIMCEFVIVERKLEMSWSVSFRGGGGEVSEINSLS